MIINNKWQHKDQGYCPWEILPNGRTAAWDCLQWAESYNRTLDEIRQAHNYLMSWPDGPRLIIGLERVADLIGVSRQALRDAIHKGRINAQSVGKSLGLMYPEIMRYVRPLRGRPKEE